MLAQLCKLCLKSLCAGQLQPDLAIPVGRFVSSTPEPRRRRNAPDARPQEAALDRNELGSLATQLAGISAQLQRVAGGDNRIFSADINPAGPVGLPQSTLLALARHAYWLRRQRAAIFGGDDLFGEPAWDILLDLYIAHGDGKQVSVSSACIGSASPPTTGLRWLAVLADKGLILRENDAADNRRIMVRLSDQGIAAVERFLALAQPQH